MSEIHKSVEVVEKRLKCYSLASRVWNIAIVLCIRYRCNDSNLDIRHPRTHTSSSPSLPLVLSRMLRMLMGGLGQVEAHWTH